MFTATLARVALVGTLVYSIGALWEHSATAILASVAR